MRKAYKVKRGSCALCHGYKTGHEPRWKPREFHALRRVERELREREWEDEGDDEGQQGHP